MRSLFRSARGCGTTCHILPATQNRLPRVSETRARRHTLFLGRRRSAQACCARAPCRDGCGWLRPLTRTPPKREASLIRRAAVARRARYRLLRQTGCRACSKRAPAGAHCFSGEGAALELTVCALCRASGDHFMHSAKPLQRREAFLPLAHDRGTAYQLRPQTQSLPPRVSQAHAYRRSVFIGRTRSTQAGCARALCRAGCGCFAPVTRTLHQRNASLLRRAAVVRRASYRLQRQTGFHA